MKMGRNYKKVNVEIEGISPLMMNKLSKSIHPEIQAKKRLKKMKAQSIIKIIGDKVKWILKVK